MHKLNFSAAVTSSSNSRILAQQAASDADWLRQRTSRTLEFLDADTPIEERGPKLKAGFVGSPTISNPSAVIQGNSDQVHSRGFHVQSQRHDLKAEASVPPSGRLLVRNLLYDVRKEDLWEQFATFGDIDELHICHDNAGRNKGFAFLNFAEASSAEKARLALHGQPFEGRNLHIENAEAKRVQRLDPDSMSRLPLKVQNRIKLRNEAVTESFKWNSLYMNPDAIMSSVATKLGVNKSDVLDPTSSDAAIRQAYAETSIIRETKAYFDRHGIDTDAFRTHAVKGKSETTILVKNFPFGTTAAEIRALFERHGAVKRLLVPPAATMAIVEMERSANANRAFSTLAYTKFRDSVLLLEKAPAALFKAMASDLCDPTTLAADTSISTNANVNVDSYFEQQQVLSTSSLFADKLPWSLTTDDLRDLFRSFDGFLSARVVTRNDDKRPGLRLSRGYGFVEFASVSQAELALLSMNGHSLQNGQPLILRPSNKYGDAAEKQREQDRQKKLASQQTRIVIKNLPFEASKKDVRTLFGTYGKLRSVRVPKKFDSMSRGFAFAEFVTAKEASNAMHALENTHLLGRRLVLEFAQADTIDPEEEIRQMQRKVELQTDRAAIESLTSSKRRKFKSNDLQEGGY